MRRTFRILGLLATVLGVFAFCHDMFSWLLSGRFVLTDFGTVWYSVHPDSLQLLQPAIERHLHPVLWRPLMMSVLLAPAFIIFSLPGLALLVCAVLRARKSRKNRFGA